MPKKKDGLLIVVVLVIAACLLGASRLLPKTDLSTKTADVTLAPDAIEYLADTPVPEATAVPEITAEPEATAEPETVQSVAVGPMPQAQTEEVKGYVVITVGNRQYGDPIAMDRDKIITIKQDSGEINKIHITPEKVYMESSTCENQDCVSEGEVTLDNYETRILKAYIFCLPNQVTIELVPAE